MDANDHTQDRMTFPDSIHEKKNDYTNINIGGNARVQLGNQYQAALSSSTVNNDITIKGKPNYVKTTTAILQVIYFCKKVLRSGLEESLWRVERSIRRAHAEAACATLESLNKSLELHKGSLRFEASVTPKAKTLPCKEVLLTVIQDCEGTAEGLRTTLAEALASNSLELQSLPELFRTTYNEQEIDFEHMKLESLESEAIACLLLILG